MEQNKKDNGISLGDIIRVIKKNIILLAIITVTITLIGGVYAFTRPAQYKATSRVLIAANEQSKSSEAIDSTDSLRFTQTYAETVKESEKIINDTINNYNNLEYTFTKDGKTYENIIPATVFKIKLEENKIGSINYISSRISTNASTESYAITISFTHDDADFAVLIVNLLTENSKKEFEYEDESNLGAFSNFKIKVMPLKSAQGASYAGVNKKLYLIIAFLAGIVLSAVVIFIKEFMSNKFRTSSDVEAMTGELPIGLFFDEKNNKNVSLLEPTINNFEPYNRLFTNIKYANVNEPYKVILFTSTIEDELKSFTSSNLSTCIANNNLKVLLIDLDLRKPTVHKTFNVIRENGIVEYASGEVEKEEIIKKTEFGVDVITSGKQVLNPFAVLESNKLKALIEDLRNEYDYILLDTAPVAMCNDAKLIAKYSDGVVYNVTINDVRKKLFLESIKQLKELDINIIGFNITKEPKSKDKSSAYYYSYKYYGENNNNNK